MSKESDLESLREILGEHTKITCMSGNREVSVDLSGCCGGGTSTSSGSNGGGCCGGPRNVKSVLEMMSQIQERNSSEESE